MRFEIKDRVIQTGSTTPSLGTQGENDIEEVEFTIAKTVGKADLSAAGTKCILYYFSLPGTEADAACKVLDFSELDEDTMIARWSVGRDETQTKGNLYIAIHFCTVFDNVLRTKIAVFDVARTINAESPQLVLYSTRAARADARDGLQPEPDPIRIIANTPIIPASLQPLAVQGDNLSKLVPIKMSRIYSGEDLSKYPISLIITTTGGGITIPLAKELTEDEITMILTVKRPITSFAGKVDIQFQVGDKVTDAFCKFTGTASSTISKSLDYEPIVPVSPPEFDEYLKQIEAIRAQAEAAKNQSVAAKDISVTKAGEAAQSVADALASKNAAASSATTANTKAGEAANSAAAAKVSETASEDALTDINSGLVSRLPISEANSLIKSVSLDEPTGILTFTKYDGTALIIDTALEKTVVNFTYDPATKELMLALESGQIIHIPLTDLIDDYTGIDTSTTSVLINGNNEVSVQIKGNSISINLLDAALQDTINGKVTANQTNNASQIKFADSQTMQQKLDSGALNGKDGVAVSVSGFYSMEVNAAGHLILTVNDETEPPQLAIDANGHLVYTVG